MSRTSDLDGDTYMGYPCHRQDKNETRRAYNRLITARNINENHGTILTERYFEQFDDIAKKQMGMVGIIIKVKGLDFMKQEINRLSTNEE